MPIVFSKLYWAVIVPTVIYGCEVIAFSDSDKDKLEIFHRFVAKPIQGLSEKTANVMCTAQLGWFSMSAEIEIWCLIFLRTLFDTATPDIYRSIAIQSWIKLSNGVTSLDRSSPMHQQIQYLTGLMMGAFPQKQDRTRG